MGRFHSLCLTWTLHILILDGNQQCHLPLFRSATENRKTYISCASWFNCIFGGIHVPVVSIHMLTVMTFEDFGGLIILEPKISLKLIQCYTNNPHRLFFLQDKISTNELSGENPMENSGQGFQSVSGESVSEAAFRTLCNVCTWIKYKKLTI